MAVHYVHLLFIMPINLDIILPIKNRDTLLMVAKTIVREMAATQHSTLGQLLVCDGGSTEVTCLQQIETISEWERVNVLNCAPSPFNAGFNKSWLMNQGLAAATGEVVLISDVDIVWDTAVLEALALAAANHSQRIYSVMNVKESDPTAVAVRRQRYTYRIEKRESGSGERDKEETETLVEICATSVGGETRPGCGIVCARRQVFERVGGYKACFAGWGWEDQDFLIRAQLLGYRVAALGEVTHLSHGDERRHRIVESGVAESIEESRNRNIMRCLAGLAKGELLGDLTRENVVVSDAQREHAGARNISVHYPPELAGPELESLS